MRDEIGGHEQDIIEAEEEEEMKKSGLASIYHFDSWPCSWPWDLTASFSALISPRSSPVVHTFPPLVFTTSVFLCFLCSPPCSHPASSETFCDFSFSTRPLCTLSFCCLLLFSPKQQGNIKNAWATSMNVLLRPCREQDPKCCLFYST